MNLSALISIQNSGALKVVAPDEGICTVGGVAINEEQARQMVANLGWVHYETTPFRIIEKTNSFISALSKGIDNKLILNNADICFENKRKMGTMSYFDRIKLVCPIKNGFDITVLYGMSGVGGKYGVYSATNNFKTPVKSFRTAKELAKWINTLV